MSDQHPSHPGRGGRGSFWTTLPGILTGLAAVITALVGLFTVLGLGEGDGGDPARDVQAEERDVRASPGADPDPPGSTGSLVAADATSSDAPGAVEGEVTMRSPDDADLEQQRVGLGVSGGDLYLYCSGDECLLSAMGSGGLITTVGGPVDEAGCLTALQARQDGVLSSADLTAGTWFCVQTDEARIALVEVTSAPGVGTAELVLAYTLWS